MTSDERGMFLYRSGVYTKVNPSEISYVKSNDNYCKVVFEKSDPILIRTTMKQMETTLSDMQFVRCHRQYIINADKVDAIDKSSLEIKLKDETVIPFSRAKKKSVLERVALDK